MFQSSRTFILAFIALAFLSACFGGGSPESQNFAPTSNAGIDQAVDEDTNVALVGTGADPDGRIDSYSWRQASGVIVTILNSDTPNASFVAPMVATNEDLVFVLTVADNEGATASDSVTVTVIDANALPVADAGADQSVNEGVDVALSGSGSDTDGSIATYLWQQTSGPTVTISNSDTADASFVAPMVATNEDLVFVLTVTDNEGATATDSVTVTVLNVNAPPVADAGADQSVNEGVDVALSGSGSDTDGSIATYLWQQTSGPTVTIANSDTADASFVAPMVTTNEDLVFELTVADNDGAMGTDTVTITVLNINISPVANAGADLDVTTGEEVALDGTGSSDADGDVLSFAWTLTTTPVGSTSTLSNATTTSPTFTPDIDGSYSIELVVNDGAVGSLMDVVTITATTPETTYSIIDLGTLGGTASHGYDLNSTRQVTGSSQTAGDLLTHAFLYDSSVLQDLDTLGGDESHGFDINESGQIVGYSDISGNTATRGFLYESGAMQDLGTLGGSSSQAFGINTNGDIVGYAHVAGDAARHAFLHDGTTMNDLGTLGGSYAVGLSINDDGLVAGFGYAPGDTVIHAFLYDGTTMNDIGTLGGSESHGIDINRSGDVVGYSWLLGDIERQAFVFDGTTMRGLGTLGGSESFGFGINDVGHVVGESFVVGDAVRRAFLYSDGEMSDLCEITDCTTQGWDSLDRADNINNNGDIVGHGFINGEQHAFLAIANVPAPEVLVDRDAFYARLGSVVVDDYEDPGYVSTMTDAEVSAVIGETSYSVVSGDPSFPSHSVNSSNGNAFTNAWCNGCNLDTLLDFTATSVGTSVGVMNVGFDIVLNGTVPYEAVVLFGDGSSRTYALSILSDVSDGTPYLFWGIRSSLLIARVQLRATSTGSSSAALVLDNLVIGMTGPGVTPPPSQLHGSP